MTEDLAMLPATELAGRYRTGALSPVAVAEACFARIGAWPRLNPFVSVDRAGALEAARAAEHRWARGAPLGPIDGVPATVKDVLLMRGQPTRRGSLAIEPGDEAWDEDAPAVERLRAGGAVILGKTTTPELGHKAVTDSRLTGITRNPWDPERTPGGSSGGAAVAAATGMGALHLGTDGAGSIRIPASFTGVVGFKPSVGRVPVHPPSVYGSLTHVGPITRTVGDAALLLEAIARPDPRDPRVAGPLTGLGDALDGGVAGLRIGIATRYGGLPVEPEVAAAVDRAAEAFHGLGAMVESVALPLDTAREMIIALWPAMVATAVNEVPLPRRARMEPGLLATAAYAAGLPLTAFVQAQVAAARLAAAMERLHRDIPLVLLPTMPIAAFAAGQDAPSDGPYAGQPNWTPFTYPFNLTGQPALSVPCGRTAAGLPVGLQIVGARFADALVLRAGRAYEQAHPWPFPPAP